MPTSNDATTLLTGGGIAGIVMASVYMGRLGLDWWSTKTAQPRVRSSAAVNDAAAANALLLTALREEREEVQRLSQRVNTVEAENARLYDERRQIRLAYESEIQELRGELNALNDRLESFQQKVRDENPEG